MGTTTVGAGGELGGMIGSDGSIEGGAEGTLGGGVGAGLLICRKRVTEKCNSPGK